MLCVRTYTRVCDCDKYMEQLYWSLFCRRSQNDVPQDHIAKKDAKGVRSTAESLNLQWTDVPGDRKGHQGATGGNPK